MKKVIVLMVLVWIFSVVPSLQAQGKSVFSDAPDWFRGGGNNGDQICVVVGIKRSKTDKMTLERLIEKADLELCRNISTIVNSMVSDYKNKQEGKQTTEKTHSVTVMTPDVSSCAITEKRFVKDTWKSPDGYMYAQVCLPNKKDIAAEIEKRRAATGKYWSDASREKKTWKEAKRYCENLKEGGFSDWRLPTIDELRSLIKNCNDTMTGGACRITDNCRTSSCFDDALSKSDCWCPKNQAEYSKLGDHGTFWSDSYYTESISSGCAVENYVLNFDSGGIATSDYLILSYDSKSRKSIINCADFRTRIPEIEESALKDGLKIDQINVSDKDSILELKYYYNVRCVR